MRTVLTALLLLVLPVFAAAQDAGGPLLRAELEKTEAVPGQPITLRITLLVPTWMPQPPEFPSFEVPNVMVRLPERASGPVSERIDGETWSGVSRAYRIYPMTVGDFRIPAQTLTITYADPETREPIVTELQTDPIAFAGVAPEGAGDLDPFIAATKLSLEQKIDGDPADLEPGGSFQQTVTARISGTAPIVLPPLIPPLTESVVAVYPKEPVVTETDDRGVLSGARVESATYVAQAGGRASIPPVRLRWFNLETGEIETAETDGFDIVSRGPPPATPRDLVDWRALLPWLIVSLAAAVLIAMAIRRVWPAVAGWRRQRRADWLASEPCAYRKAEEALKSKNFAAAMQAVEIWASHPAVDTGGRDPGLADALAGLGGAYYGSEKRTPSPERWSDALNALRAARRSRLAASTRAGAALPPLNPRTSG